MSDLSRSSMHSRTYNEKKKTCPMCNGDKKIYKKNEYETCYVCNGYGYVYDTESGCSCGDPNCSSC